MPSVVLACNALGVGGTERGMTTQALALDRTRFDVRILGVSGSGPQKRVLEAAGLAVQLGEGRLETLVDLVRGADVVVHLRQGNADPLLPAACRRAGVPHVVDWNVFGQVDRSADEPRFACHLFISKTMQLRYRAWAGHDGPGFHDRHRVHYLPVDPALSQRAPNRADACRLLGLDPDRPVVGRTGRPVDIKWRNLLVDMVPHLLREVPDAQLAFVGTTPAKVKRLRRLGVLEQCTLIEPTLEEDRLAAFYAACDVFVSASEIGEAQGLANLEAMSFGVPVVTCSMPWADNAQVEFVEHGRTGLIANHPRSFAEAVAALLVDSRLRERLGAQARSTVARRFDPAVQARQLERLFTSLLSMGKLPAEWTPSPAEVDSFAAEYERRARLQYRPLHWRERVEAESTRLRERVTRSARVRHAPRTARADAPVFVGVTTLPSRIGKLEPTLASLRAQTLPPDRIFVCIPHRSVREQCEYEIPSWLAPPPAGVQLVRTERDYGPATKLLGCLPHIHDDACLITVDDDMAYKPFLVERLYQAQMERTDASFSFFVERIGRLRCGQAADGFSHWTPNLAGIEEFAETALRSRHLFVADDWWISLFLQDRGVAVEGLQDTLARGELVCEPTHAENQLRDLGGDLRRPNTFRQGRRFMLRTNLVGRRLRLACRVSVLEHAARRTALRAANLARLS